MFSGCSHGGMTLAPGLRKMSCTRRRVIDTLRDVADTREIDVSRMEHAYLVRYGVMHDVSRFSSDTADFERGQSVVIRTHRGIELGQVLLRIPRPSDPGDGSTPASSAVILRSAGPGDLERGLRADLERPHHFTSCRHIMESLDWPVELIDVEVLLDPGRVVLHYLGPRPLDLAGLLASFRSRCGLDVMLEPVGLESPGSLDHVSEALGQGHCGAGCGDRGAGAGCGSSPGLTRGGCSDCGVKRILASRRPIPSR